MTEFLGDYGESGGGYFSGSAHCPGLASFSPLLVFSRWTEPRMILPQYDRSCLAVNSNVRENDGRRNKKEVVVGQRDEESTVVLSCFVGTKDHTLGEKLALVCTEICTTHADVLITVSDLILVQVWISQWSRFASQELTPEGCEG